MLIKPIDNKSFPESLRTCHGVLCGAGFETPAEALFLRKKLMVVPMKGQYEQQCNAVALKNMGVPVLKSLKKKYNDKITNWLESTQSIEVDYPDISSEIIDTIIKNGPYQVNRKALQSGIKSITG